MTTLLHIIRWAALALVLGGCAALRPGYQSPTVELVDIKPLASQSLQQRVQLTLRIINPNREALAIRGMSYSLSLQGHNIITGVSSHIPVIDGYSEAGVTLDAATNLLGGLQVLRSLISPSAGPSVEYELAARLDIRGRWLPLTIRQRGDITLPAISGH